MRLDTQSQSDSEDSIAGVTNVATSGSYRVLPASDSPPPMCPFPPTAMVYSMRGLGKFFFFASILFYFFASSYLLPFSYFCIMNFVFKTAGRHRTYECERAHCLC